MGEDKRLLDDIVDRLQRRVDAEKKKTQTENVMCKECNKIFKTIYALKRHMHTVHEEDRTFECHLCGKFYLRKDNLQFHIKSKHSNIKPEHRYSCSKCGETFKKLYYRNQHCRTCCPSARGQPVAADEDVDEDVDVDTQQMNPQTDELTCNHCNEVFTSDEGLRRHINETHEEDATFILCNYCGKRFSRKYNLQLHIKSRHSDRKPKYPCSKCGKTFTKPSYRNQHCRISCPSVREQPLPGDESASVDVEVGAETQPSFVESGSSTVPSERPSNLDKECSCSNCGQTFKLPSYHHHCRFSCPSTSQQQPVLDCTGDESEDEDMLDEDTQETEMQHGTTVCDHCNKDFATPFTLRRHMQTIHQVDRPFFECDHCGKRFRRAENLREHKEAKHSDGKPEYPCSKCGKSFSSSRYRNHHCRTCCPSAREQPLAGYTGDESAAMDVDVDTQVGAQTQTAVEEPGPSTVPSKQPLILKKRRVVYICPKCGGEYLMKHNLTRHLMLGCEVPAPWRCSYCDYKTHYKSSLNRHIFLKHSSVCPQ